MMTILAGKTRRFDLAAEVRALSAFLGEFLPSLSEDIPPSIQQMKVSSRFAEVGPQHECFIYSCAFLEWKGMISLHVHCVTRYGRHTTHRMVTEVQWAKILKQAKITRIPFSSPNQAQLQYIHRYIA